MPWPFPKAKYNRNTPLHAIRGADLQTVYNILNDLTGVGCYIERTVSGFGWKIVIDDSAIMRMGPWAIVSKSGEDFTFREGYVEIHKDDGCAYIDNGGDDIELTLSSDATNYVWIETDLSAGIPATYTARNGTTSKTEYDDSATTYTKLIWEITLDADGTMTSAIKHQWSNIEFVGWRPSS